MSEQPLPAHSEPSPELDDLLLDEPEEVGPGLAARCAAELFGTFVLVLAGVGVALYLPVSNLGSLAVPLAFGFALVAGTAAVGRVSGGHFNPAVTLAAAITGRLSWTDLLPYWVSQLVGGAVATAVLFLTVPTGLGQLIGLSADKRELFSRASNGFGAHSPLGHAIADANVTSETSFNLVAALLVEVVATAVLVGVYLAVTRRQDRAPHAPYVIGLTFTTLLLVALPVTNASLNPARSTATAVFAPTWALGQLWLFWVAPLLGAAIAALVHLVVASPTAPEGSGEVDEVPDDLDVDDEPAGPTGVA